MLAYRLVVVTGISRLPAGLVFSLTAPAIPSCMSSVVAIKVDRTTFLSDPVRFLGDGQRCWKVMGARTGCMVGAGVYAAGAVGHKCAVGLPACVGTMVSEAALSSSSRISAQTLTSLRVVARMMRTCH